MYREWIKKALRRWRPGMGPNRTDLFREASQGGFNSVECKRLAEAVDSAYCLGLKGAERIGFMIGRI